MPSARHCIPARASGQETIEELSERNEFSLPGG